MLPKHTSGPWKLIPPGEPTPGPMYRKLIALVSDSPSLYVVLDDGHALDRVPPEEWEDNARLIAAAPDLYTALRDLREAWCLNFCDAASPDEEANHLPECYEARAALRKADGDVP